MIFVCKATPILAWLIKRDKLARKDPQLLAYYDKSFASGLRDSDLSCATLLPMIQFDCAANGRFPNEVVYKKAQDLRNVEEKLRNPAAHNITAIKEEYFTRVAGISSDRVLKDLQWMFRYTTQITFQPV